MRPAGLQDLIGTEGQEIEINHRLDALMPERIP